MNCSKCGQRISKKLQAEKRKLKAKRVSEALQTAKQLGEPVGRPRKFDRSHIHALPGLSVRELAIHFNVSDSTIRRALKEGKR